MYSCSVWKENINITYDDDAASYIYLFPSTNALPQKAMMASFKISSFIWDGTHKKYEGYNMASATHEIE